MDLNAREAALSLKARGARDPMAAWEGLDALFRSGQAPEPPLDGDYAGELLLTRTLAPLDALARAFDRQGLWWLGKAFDAAGDRGENRFDRRFRTVTRVLWPLYRGLRDDPAGAGTRPSAARGGCRGFRFRTWVGPGVRDPDRSVLKIDYSAEPNPLAVRRVLDELVQVGPEYYLGNAHLHLPGDRWRTVAFFALCQPSAISHQPSAEHDPGSADG
jgi:hypothetical protein